MQFYINLKKLLFITIFLLSDKCKSFSINKFSNKPSKITYYPNENKISIKDNNENLFRNIDEYNQYFLIYIINNKYFMYYKKYVSFIKKEIIKYSILGHIFLILYVLSIVMLIIAMYYNVKIMYKHEENIDFIIKDDIEKDKDFLFVGKTPKKRLKGRITRKFNYENYNVLTDKTNKSDNSISISKDSTKLSMNYMGKDNDNINDSKYWVDKYCKNTIIKNDNESIDLHTKKQNNNNDDLIDFIHSQTNFPKVKLNDTISDNSLKNEFTIDYEKVFKSSNNMLANNNTEYYKTNKILFDVTKKCDIILENNTNKKIDGADICKYENDNASITEKLKEKKLLNRTAISRFINKKN